MASVELLLPVGRIVAGHPRRARKRLEDDGRTPRLRDGKEILVYGFGFAIPKADWPGVAAAMGQAAAGIDGNTRPDFAWKFRDGDTGVDGEGKPLNQKEGYAGCNVLWIETEISDLIKVFQRVDANNWREMSETEINTGDYVRPRVVIEGHGKKAGVATSKPGLYINPQGVEFVGYGTRIFTGGPDANAMFGSAAPAALPPGASATPIPSTGATVMPGGPPAAAPAGYPQPGPAPAPAGYPQPAPAPAPAPAAAYPTPAPQPAAPPIPPGYPQPAPTAPAAATYAPAPAPAPAPMPATAYPSNPAPAPVQPAHDFVQNAVRQPIGFDPATGRPIYAYQPGTNRPIFGYDPSGQWPIFGFDPAGNPVYQ